jgi:hypothetical protein
MAWLNIKTKKVVEILDEDPESNIVEFKYNNGKICTLHWNKFYSQFRFENN